MVKAVIFDCFGVLITDGLELFIQKLEKTNPDARRYIFDTIRQSNAGVIHPSESNRLITEYLDPADKEWRQKVAAGEVKNTELITWIRQLHKTFKTALLSNTGKGSLKRRFALGELEELFDEIVVSAEIGITKPDAEIYRLTAGRLGISCEECVFFDDRTHHVEGALATGMHAFLFTNVDQAKADLDKLLKT